MRVLVTGATGFVGRVCCDTLARSGYVVRAALRKEQPVPSCVSETVVTGEIGSTTSWQAALNGVGAVVHLAARVHILYDEHDGSSLYAETNARGTHRLAEAAAGAGVSRFVYLSSVKVNGEETGDRAHRASDDPCPQDGYGASKLLAERSLMEVVARTGMQAAIVRPPLVYGAGVRANFLRLMQWVDKQWPIPLGAVDNRRSLVSVWNLCDLVVNLLQNPAACGRVWMVSDGEDLSTADLIRRIGYAMGRRVRLLSVPISMLRLCGGLIGRKREINRLCDSLLVDIAPTRLELRWSPPMTVDEALRRTVAWYESEGRALGT
jgi:nucleoside-diphosphate-sugar epimerase